MCARQQVARRILKASGVVDEKDSHGCTPLIRASQMIRPRLAAFLLASGANPSIRSAANNMHSFVAPPCCQQACAPHLSGAAGSMNSIYLHLVPVGHTKGKHSLHWRLLRESTKGIAKPPNDGDLMFDIRSRKIHQPRFPRRSTRHKDLVFASLVHASSPTRSITTRLTHQ